MPVSVLPGFGVMEGCCLGQECPKFGMPQCVPSLMGAVYTHDVGTGNLWPVMSLVTMSALLYESPAPRTLVLCMAELCAQSERARQ